MAREMNKKERQLTAEQTTALIAKGKTGTLCLNGDDGYPYGVPVNYVYFNDAIYIHGANQGYKVDAVKANPKACFSCYVNVEILADQLTAAFESFIATGKVEMVEDKEEKKAVLDYIVDQLSEPAFKEKGSKMIAAMLDKTGIIKFTIEEVKGKAYDNARW